MVAACSRTRSAVLAGVIAAALPWPAFATPEANDPGDTEWKLVCSDEFDY